MSATASTALCRACSTITEAFAKATVLGHVEATYQRCPTCGMVIAVDPHWLDEAYSDAIAKLDIGLLDRCVILSNITAMVIKSQRVSRGRFADWAGGYGTLTRLLRDRGYDFVHSDPMAVNVFAEGHEVPDLSGARYDLITAFEVLEHLSNPIAELAPAAAATDLLLTTTHLLPDPPPKPEQWWYYTLESGQHITFYTQPALDEIAEQLGFDGVVGGSFVHLFYRGRLSAATKALVSRPGIAYGAGLLASLPDRRRSLLAADLEQVKNATHP